MTLRIRNQQRKIRIVLGRLKKIAQGVLQEEGKPDVQLDILVTDNRRITGYHKKYLGIKGPTDVIAFGMQEGKRIAGNKNHLGDIVISAEMANRVSHRLNIPVHEEIERYLVHGILHLLGYRDHTPRAARRMHRRQEELLRNFSQ